MAHVLLINPSYSGTYGSTKAGITNPITPTLGLATIAGEALRRGHTAEILDLSHRPYDWRLVEERIRQGKPDVVGITATTPLMNQLRDISVLCKDISPSILVVGGGAHVSALPHETMLQSRLDLALVGEADFTFGDICDGADPKTVAGLYYRDAAGMPVFTGNRPLLENLDELAIPAWHLYNAEEYRGRISRLLARRVPVTLAEFSRGCVFKCDFCASKMTMALGYRKKSPERCAEEVALLYKLGWRELMLADDIFTSDAKWAEQVCRAISDSGVDMIWSCTNGIRVESASDTLFQSMRKAGCYRVSFGFETGNDEVLKAFGKGGKATIERGRVAVKMARRAGIDTNGFFMLGLTGDTNATMDDTINYARTLELDMMKFGLCIPFPGTPMFNHYARQGLVRTFEWDDYHIYSDIELFAHPDISHAQVKEKLAEAYRKAILLNPRFVMRRLWRGIKTREFMWDAYYFFKFMAATAIMPETDTAYYARDRWPAHDFQAAPPREVAYQTATYQLRTVRPPRPAAEPTVAHSH